MTRERWRVGLVGFGRMAAGYSDDPAMAKHYPFATHAQVLLAHPRLEWRAVVDSDVAALENARTRWGVQVTSPTVDGLGPAASEIDIVVLATPPSARLGIVRGLPGVRAMLVEKPLGEDLVSADRFLAECGEHGLMVQVNFWRRSDRLFRELAEGRLAATIGRPMAVSCFYGNGLLNNGSHMIDMVRMFFGEVASVQIFDAGNWSYNGPIPGDRNPCFCLRLVSGLIVHFVPIDFRSYRENGIIVWGAEGRLEILNEGLVVRSFPRKPNRAMSGEFEVSSDESKILESTVGDALYQMFDNIVDALDHDDPARLYSPGVSAMESTRWVDVVAQAAVGATVPAAEYVQQH
ncbi:MAG: Gfo/Idh/MocA family oxidoreductase [Alphaproteobacteria bacterium]|nr:Gfo/Idh/MocA family oxidoreductase [Alphaproteobacteria bacterium]